MNDFQDTYVREWRCNNEASCIDVDFQSYLLTVRNVPHGGNQRYLCSFLSYFCPVYKNILLYKYQSEVINRHVLTNTKNHV